MKIIDKVDANGKAYLYPDYSEEIARGAAVLDEVAPGWEDDIDVSLLNLASTNSCVLGQGFQKFHLAEVVRTHLDTAQDGDRNFGQLFNALRDAGFLKDHPASMRDSELPYHYGFDAHYYHDFQRSNPTMNWRDVMHKHNKLLTSIGMPAHEALTFQWIDLIKARRLAKGDEGAADLVNQVNRAEFALAGPKAR